MIASHLIKSPRIEKYVERPPPIIFLNTGVNDSSMILSKMESRDKNGNSFRKNESEYPCFHNQGVDNDIYCFLLGTYEERGRNFFFKAAQLPFALLSAQRKGAAVRRICEATQVMEKWNTGRIMVWRTKFTAMAGESSIPHGSNMKE
ncbi:MAG: hypothetical protein KKC68_00425 [Candidatus Thermoplasmatota archaeon]|nr:hypothetical protein [Candidatus Thermoplasmatota archaeon]